MYGQQDSSDFLFRINVSDWLSSPGVNHSRTHVSAPFEVSSYSRDGNRNVTFGSKEQLATYTEPKLNVNLGEKFASYIPKRDEDVGVETVVKALQSKQFDIDTQADIVTYRNNMNKIGGTPYENRDGWELDCALVAKTVFLDIRKTNKESTDPQQQRFMYYGYRFESLCTGLEDEPVNANSEYCSISRLRIANHRILMASEIDCSSGAPDKGGNPLNGYIELKTMRVIENERALNSMYRFRFLKYWLQSYLGGVPTIMLGLRSDAGDLLHVKKVKTHEIPREARHHFDKTRSNNRWDPFVCINFLDCILASIREVCHDHPGCTIRVRFDPSSKQVTAVKVTGVDAGLAPRINQLRQEATAG